MIRQCLSNKNESATVSKSKMFSHLNKPFVSNRIWGSGPEAAWAGSKFFPVLVGHVDRARWVRLRELQHVSRVAVSNTAHGKPHALPDL